MLCLIVKTFQMEEQEIKSIFLDMSNNSIPANAHNKVVAGENANAATGTAEEMKADFLNRVEKMYDFVNGMGEKFSIKSFFSTLDDMMKIAKEIDDVGIFDDEQLYDVWELILMFNDDWINGMSISCAQEYLEMRLSSIIKILQGEKIIFR